MAATESPVAIELLRMQSSIEPITIYETRVLKIIQLAPEDSTLVLQFTNTEYPNQDKEIIRGLLNKYSIEFRFNEQDILIRKLEYDKNPQLFDDIKKNFPRYKIVHDLKNILSWTLGNSAVISAIHTANLTTGAAILLAAGHTDYDYGSAAIAGAVGGCMIGAISGALSWSLGHTLDDLKNSLKEVTCCSSFMFVVSSVVSSIISSLIGFAILGAGKMDANDVAKSAATGGTVFLPALGTVAICLHALYRACVSGLICLLNYVNFKSQPSDPNTSNPVMAQTNAASQQTLTAVVTQQPVMDRPTFGLSP